MKLTLNRSLHYDPSRTTLVRRSFVADLSRRLKALRAAVRELFAEDALSMVTNLAPKYAYAYASDATKLKDFNEWLQQQIDAKVLTIDSGKYVESAYKKGAVRAYVDSHRADLATSNDFYDGDGAAFLRDAFSSGEMLGKLELVASRTFEELKGVSATMGQQMNRLLADGLAQGWNPNKTAREMFQQIGKLERTRYRVIARTETIRAHAEGQLDAFDRLGVEKVGAQIEWSTAGDDRVCEECASMEGNVFSVDEAHGYIPLHPQCRCAWVPVNVGEKV